MTFTSCPARNIELASVALEALNTLERPVGEVDSDRDFVAGNRLFCELFCGKPRGLDPRGCFPASSDLSEHSTRGSFVNGEGRTFKIEIARLAQGVLVVAEEISQQRFDHAEAHSAARTDLASGLGNLLMFRERLAECLQRLDPAKDVAVVLAVSLDRFKTLAASLDRNTRAAFLGLVVERLRSVTVNTDILARISDDEFAIVQANSAQPRSATALAMRLVDLLGRSYLVNGRFLHIGACVGACLIPLDGDDCDKILYNVDLALSRAKQDGPGHFRFFETAMDEQCEARRSLEVDLRRALALRELSLVYQPQFNLASERVTGFEALLRWRHPKRGFVSPVDFIPLAEELGLITPIGEWVVQTACREAARWPDGLRVAVNVSAVQFRGQNLSDRISSALAESGLEPGRLELEITESVLLGEPASVLGQLHGLRRMGIRISMDDFGTGYSSLSYLQSFPFDKIKIDQSFIRGAVDEAKGAAIMCAIAALGLSLGMATTAEGVETDEQLARVTAAGCTDIQGYLISKPLLPESVETFLQSRNHGPTIQAPTGKPS